MAIKINRVQAYKSTDGILFVDREAYIAHERKLAFGEKIDALVSAKFEEFATESGEGYYEMDIGQVADFILTNSDDLRLLLNGKTKRAPRAKKSKETVAVKPKATPVKPVVVSNDSESELSELEALLA